MSSSVHIPQRTGLFTADQMPTYDTFGTNSLTAFRRACVECIATDREHATFYRLLADHTERLIDAYHQTPLDSAIAERDFKHFQMLIAIAERAYKQPAEQKMNALNTMASADFF